VSFSGSIQPNDSLYTALLVCGIFVFGGLGLLRIGGWSFSGCWSLLLGPPSAAWSLFLGGSNLRRAWEANFAAPHFVPDLGCGSAALFQPLRSFTLLPLPRGHIGWLMRRKMFLWVAALALLYLAGCATERGGTGEEYYAGSGVGVKPSPTMRPGMDPQDFRDPTYLSHQPEFGKVP